MVEPRAVETPVVMADIPRIVALVLDTVKFEIRVP